MESMCTSAKIPSFWVDFEPGLLKFVPCQATQLCLLWGEEFDTSKVCWDLHSHPPWLGSGWAKLFEASEHSQPWLCGGPSATWVACPYIPRANVGSRCPVRSTCFEANCWLSFTLLSKWLSIPAAKARWKSGTIVTQTYDVSSSQADISLGKCFSRNILISSSISWQVSLSNLINGAERILAKNKQQ